MSKTRTDWSEATPAELEAEALRRRALLDRGVRTFADSPIQRFSDSSTPAPSALRASGPKATLPRWLDNSTGLAESFSIAFPWSSLCPDNAKYAPALRGKKPVLLLTAAYRAAKKAMTRQVSEELVLGPPGLPWRGRVLLRAVVFEPDRRTRRDPSNYSKVTHDALSGLVYADDSQIDVSWWLRGPKDIDRPRLEVLVYPLADS